MPSKGEIALQALALLAEGVDGVDGLGDFVYNIRENNGGHWHDPHVTAWSEGCQLATEALKPE